MDRGPPPVVRVADPYYLDNIPSLPAAASVSTNSAKLSAPGSANTLSALSSSPVSTAKRQRALSEEVDHARKRHAPSSPWVRAQSATVKAKTNDRIISSSNRDSGFHEVAPEAEAQNKLASVAASREGDSGFQDAVSSIDSDEERAKTKVSPGPDGSVADAQQDEAPRSTQVTETDDDYHDALGEHESDALPAGDTDTVWAASEKTIVVSSRREGASERSIVVCRAADAQEHAIQVQPTPSKRARGTGSDTDGAQDKTPHRSAPVSRRNQADHAKQQSIVVSGPNHDEDQTIHAKPQTEAKSKANADHDQDDNEYTVSRIIAHRTASGSDDIELLVHWEDSPDDNTTTWELEENLQEKALDAVVDYWATVKGGRIAVRPYEVYAITGHEWLKKGRVKSKSLYLEVEWLGYKEKSMEPVRRFSQDQPELVEEYFQSIGGRPKLR